MNKIKKSIVAALAGTLGVAGSAAHAQDSSDDRLEEIVVTAERRSANLQNVAIPVTAFSTKDLADSNFHDLQDLNNMVPGLSIGGSGGINSPVALRGLAPAGGGIGQDDPVALYIDGVHQGQIGMNLKQAMLGVERIEILRGPQGTLYGRNAVGGAIVVTTRKPTEETHAEIKIGAGNYETSEISTLLSGQISDRVYGLVTARQFKREKGFKDNLATTRPSDGVDESAFRGVLRIVPSDELEINFIADYSEYEGAGNGPMRNILDYENNPGCTDCDRDPSDSSWEEYYGWPNGDEQQNDLTAPLIIEANDWLVENGYPRQLMYTDEGADVERGGLALNIDYDLNGMVLHSSTSYRYTDNENTIDTFARHHPTVTNMGYSNQEQFAQELTLRSTGSGRLQWLAGVAYFEENIELVNIYRRVYCTDGAGGLLGQYLGAADCVDGNEADDILKYNGVRLRKPTIDTKSLAIFGQATYDFTDRLAVTLGVRLSDEEKAWTHEYKNFTTPIADATFQKATESWESVSPKVGLTFQMTDDAMLFATRSEGFKAGGFDARSLAPGGESVAPESSVQYEVGAKTEFADNKVRLNVAAFYNDYTDLQLRVFCPPTNPVCGGSTALVNAAGADVTGAEVEFSVLAAPGLVISGFVNILDAKFTDYKPNATDDFTGNGLPRAPDLQYALTANYSTTLSSGSELSVVGSYKWSDWEWYRANNTPLDRNKSNHNVNAQFSYRDSGGKWEVRLWGKNLTNEIYRNDAFAIGAATTAIFYNDPKTYGLEFIWHTSG
jgi:iron complex outermembrane receptor protein